MRKSSLLPLGLLALITAGCSSDIPMPESNDGNVTISVSLPASMGTRAFGDGLQATSLSYAIYDNATKVLVASGDDAATFANLKATLQVSLVNGRSYDFVFWADNGASSPYTFVAANAEGDVKVDMNFAASNNENLDAFYGSTTKTIDGPTTVSATLTRPFAQVNLGTDDLNADPVTKVLTDLKVSLKASTYTSMNPFTGEVLGDETEITFNATDVPTGETFPVENYEYLSMVYLLVTDEQELLDLTYTITNEGETLASVPVANVPVQRNYRTNIYGSVITSPATLNITISEDFNGDNPHEIVTAQSITTPEQLTTALADGGVCDINAPMGALDLTNLNPASPLTLNVKQAVTSMRINTTGDGSQPVTINVAKDVPFPAFSFVTLGTINNLTISGDVNSSYKCAGLQFAGLGIKINGLTVKNVPFEGERGVHLQYNTNTQVGYVTNMQNITVEGCDFKDMLEPAVSFQCHNNVTNVLGNIVIKNNTISYAAAATPTTNGLYLLDINTGTLTVEGNTITNAKYHGIQVTSSVPTVISGNKVINALEDGIKMQSCGGNMTITDNNLQAKANGIRVKGTTASCDITVTGNTINMSDANAFSNGEPYGILLTGVTNNATPLVIVENNIKVGNATGENWFDLNDFTPATGSNYANPYNN